MIDIHAHLFNLKYVPVSGILLRYSNNLIPFNIAKGIEYILIKATKSDFDEKISPFVEKPKTIYEITHKNKFDFKPAFSLFEEKEENLTSFFVNNLTLEDSINSNELRLALEDFESLIKSEDVTYRGDIVQTLSILSEMNENLLADKNEKKAVENFSTLCKRMIEWVFKQIDIVGNNLKWFYFMTKSESEIWEQLQKDERGIKIYTNLLMDVDNYFDDYNGETSSYFKYVTQQIPQMCQLNEKLGNKVIGFVAFDPKRVNSLEIITTAIKDYNFKGVKFYPALGYKASENPDSEIEERINALFKHCEDKDIPILSHCNNGGFEAYPKKSGANSNPKYWEKVLKKYPNLRLCLAHAGGIYGWFSENKPQDIIEVEELALNTLDDKNKEWNNSYAQMVYKLCITYKNVYCDAAYLDEVYDNNDIENYKKRLLSLWSKEQKYPFYKKMMYGSDWHMLFREGKQDTYYTKYLELFEDKDLSKYKDNFFTKNAIEYLTVQGKKLVTF